MQHNEMMLRGNELMLLCNKVCIAWIDEIPASLSLSLSLSSSME